MKIVSFVVRVECENCQGKKLVPGGQREYGELTACPVCQGRGTMEGYTSYEDFATLIHRIAALSRRKT